MWEVYYILNFKEKEGIFNKFNVDCTLVFNKNSWIKHRWLHLLNHENGHLLIGALFALEFKKSVQE